MNLSCYVIFVKLTDLTCFILLDSMHDVDYLFKLTPQVNAVCDSMTS